ncbi:MAG TPA: hypothetical protein VHW69_11220 [Rhizomicrobium sp.]|jgi:hypothetical protein|nr:hypothetical protein [Rhizomicrobium sp.]
MSKQTQHAGMLTSANAARLVLATAGLAAMAWAFVVFSVAASESTISEVGNALLRGEVFKSEVLASLDAHINPDTSSGFRSALLHQVVMIRLSRAEEATHSNDPMIIDQGLKSLSRILDQTLNNAPDDPFTWLVKFWCDGRRDGLRAGNFAYLRMSYELGPYESWISATRNPQALTAFPALPSDLADRVVSEFAGFVKWRLDSEAAAIAAGPGRPIRSILFSRLAELDYGQRRAFANTVYRMELDDVPVPGIAPPTPQIPMPVLPPNF